MPKNLKEKIAIVLEDCQTLQKHELLRKLEQLVVEEIGFLSAEHKLDSYDLNLIRSHSINIYTERRLSQDAMGAIYNDGEMIRTLCYVEAVIMFLRGKGLINFTTLYTKK